MTAMSTKSSVIVGGVAWMAGTALGLALCRAAKDGDQWTKDHHPPNRASPITDSRAPSPPVIPNSARVGAR